MERQKEMAVVRSSVDIYEIYLHAGKVCGTDRGFAAEGRRDPALPDYGSDVGEDVPSADFRPGDNSLRYGG